jgi:hypothetical protein
MQRCFLMGRLLIVFVLVILSRPASAADIFVYKGTIAIRGSLDVANSFPPSVRVYVVVDFETGEARGILYHNRGGKVQFVNNSPFKVTRVTLPSAKTGTVIAYGGTSQTSVNEFSFSAVVLQGTDVSLKIETDPASRIVSRPRVFAGIGAAASSQTGTDGFVQFANYKVTLQPALTLDANNNNKTIDTVITELSGALQSQGYQIAP